VTAPTRGGGFRGWAGFSRRGQRELVEAVMGRGARGAGEFPAGGEPFHATRREIRRHRVFSLPEEPLRSACVPGMSVAENMSLRNFDRAPQSSAGWLRPRALRTQAERWIRAFGILTQSADAPIMTLPA